MFKPPLQFAQGQAHRAQAGLAGDFHRPIERIDALRPGRYTVVADEEPFGGRHLVVEQVRRGFRIQRMFVQHPQTRLAKRVQLARYRQPRGVIRHCQRQHTGRTIHHCQRPQAGGRTLSKGNRRYERSRHCRYSGSLDKAATSHRTCPAPWQTTIHLPRGPGTRFAHAAELS